MELSAEQRDIREAVSELTRDIVMPTARGADATGTFPEDVWEELANINLTGLRTPTEHGGFEVDTRTYAIVNEELAYGSLAVATALSSPLPVEYFAIASVAVSSYLKRPVRWADTPSRGGTQTKALLLDHGIRFVAARHSERG